MWLWLEKREHDDGPGISRVCVAPEDIAKSIPSVETEASRQGQTYYTTHGGVIKNNGRKNSDDVFRDV